MPRRPLGLLVLALGLAVPAGCSGDIDLKQALAVTDIFSGYYDNGFKDGKPHLVPNLTFRLKNQSATEIPSIEIDVAFWQEGRDAESDSVQVKAFASGGLAPGATSEPMTVRARWGYTLDGAKEDFFINSLFKDFIAKMFAKRSGRIFPLGEFRLDRRIIPHQSSPARP
jgi:hypothetical protein